MEFSHTTALVPPSQRLDYWQHIVSSHCIPAISETSHHGAFDAEITGRSLGTLTISKLAGPQHRWIRDARRIQTGPEDSFWLSYLGRGIGELEQGGKRMCQRDGDIALYDASRPFSYAVAPEALFIVRIPRDLLAQRTGNIERLVATTLAPGSGFRTVLGALIQEALSAQALESAPFAQASIAASILDIVRAIIELQHGQQDISVQTALYGRALAYIQDHIQSQELHVEQIARAMRVSPRTLSRAFAMQGTTPMKCIWKKRLEASHQALREGRVRNVTESALTYGFCDLSHFSRAFKKSYGITPQSLLVHR